MASERPPRDPIKRAAMMRSEAPARPSVPQRRFIHLRVHSAYSLLEGALHVGKVIAHAVNDSAPAICVADTNNLFGALEFAQKASKEGVQPIIGCQLSVAFNDSFPEARKGNRRNATAEYDALVLLAATQSGYDNLVRLVSRAYLNHEAGTSPHITLDWLRELSDGIICLSGGPRGAIGVALQAGRREVAEQRLLFLKDVFGDRLYVELERLQGYDKAVEAATVALAYAHELPLVATNEAFFQTRDDYEAHDALIAIAEGAVVAMDDRRRLTPDNYLK